MVIDFADWGARLAADVVGIPYAVCSWGFEGDMDVSWAWNLYEEVRREFGLGPAPVRDPSAAPWLRISPLPERWVRDSAPSSPTTHRFAMDILDAPSEVILPAWFDQLDPTSATASLLAMLPAAPAHLREALVYAYGDRGGEWLDDLEPLLAPVLRDWGLTVEYVYDTGQLSYCAAVQDRASHDLVLKASPDKAHASLEIAALRAWGPPAVPRIFKASEAIGVFLMQRIETSDHPEPVAPESVARLATRLHRADVTPPSALSATVGSNVGVRLEWAASRFAGAEWVNERSLLRSAASLVGQLADACVSPRLLHGDFQGKNLLCNAHGYLTAIDPLPCVGDPGFDLALWAVSHAEPDGLGDRLVRVSEATGYELDKLQAWAWAVAVIELRPTLPAKYAELTRYVMAGGDYTITPHP
jgi:streptomycin 6-kinase